MYRNIISTGFLLLFASASIAQLDSLQLKELSLLTERVKSLEDTRETYLYWAGAGFFIFTVIASLGGWSILKFKLKEVISERLANKLKVPTEVLEDALKDLSKDYSAKHKKRLLVISQENDQNDALRKKLIQGGFNRENLDFKGIQQGFDTTGVDIIIFNDSIDSKLELANIKEIIASRNKQVNTYFYFGSNNDLPMKEWREEFKINMTGANFEDTLIRNLLNALKTYT